MNGATSTSSGCVSTYAAAPYKGQVGLPNKPREKRMRVHVRRRSYKGQFGLPKSNKPREIVLPPPARDALLTLPRTDHLIFRRKRGQLISQATLSGYWSLSKSPLADKSTHMS